MYEIIGELIPLAAGIAISPIPIIATTLILLSPRHISTSLGFLAGWLVGIALASGAFVLLAEVIPEAAPDSPDPIAGVIKLALGVGLLFLAAHQWRSRPPEGETIELPKWMAQIDEMSGVKSIQFGLMLAVVNPKNLLLSASAGLSIAESETPTLLPLAVFIFAASLSIIGPIAATLVAPRAMRDRLHSLRSWLITNYTAIVTVILIVIGIVVVGEGISSF